MAYMNMKFEYGTMGLERNYAVSSVAMLTSWILEYSDFWNCIITGPGGFDQIYFSHVKLSDKQEYDLVFILKSRFMEKTFFSLLITRIWSGFTDLSQTPLF